MSLFSEIEKSVNIFQRNIFAKTHFEFRIFPFLIGYIPIFYRSLFDYVLDIDKRVWMPWKWLVPAYTHDRSKNFSEILVPTIDTLRTTWFLKIMNDLKRPVLLVGETGTSKTAVIHDFLRGLPLNKFVRSLSYLKIFRIFTIIYFAFSQRNLCFREIDSISISYFRKILAIVIKLYKMIIYRYRPLVSDLAKIDWAFSIFLDFEFFYELVGNSLTWTNFKLSRCTNGLILNYVAGQKSVEVFKFEKDSNFFIWQRNISIHSWHELFKSRRIQKASSLRKTKSSDILQKRSFAKSM